MLSLNIQLNEVVDPVCFTFLLFKEPFFFFV
jgi:hypothetical protein